MPLRSMSPPRPRPPLAPPPPAQSQSQGEDPDGFKRPKQGVKSDGEETGLGGKDGSLIPRRARSEVGAKSFKEVVFFDP
jgi:hypothetical protein